MLRRSLLPILLLLVACDQQDAIKRFTPADADRRSRDYIALFVHGHPDSAELRLIPALRGDTARQILGGYAALLKDKSFDSTRVIGAVTNTLNGTRRVSLLYELHDPAGWYLAHVITVDTASDWAVERIMVQTLDAPLEQQHRFTLTGKTAAHYGMLALTFVTIATSLGTALYMATRRGMPRRWAWVLASLFGAAMVRMDWTSGAVDFKPIYFQMFAGGFIKAGPAAPWILTASLPVGALVAIDRYRRWRARQPL